MERIVDKGSMSDFVAKRTGRSDDRPKDALRTVDHLIYVIGALDENTARKSAAAMMDYLPVRLQEKFALHLTHRGIIHCSFLHSLTTLGFGGLGGIIIFDQISYTFDAIDFLYQYLPMIEKEEAKDFVDFAVGLILKPPEVIRDELQNHPHFPENYLQEVDVDSILSMDNISDLVIKVCDYKDIEVPGAVCEIRIKAFFGFLCDEFGKENVHTSDFVSMTYAALRRYNMDVDVAIDFLRDRSFFEAAEFFADRAGKPLPSPSSNRDGARHVAFRNPPCDPNHNKMGAVLKDVGQFMVVSDAALNALGKELEQSDYIAMMSHEPPVLMPKASTFDMLTVRTKNQSFHFLIDGSPTFARRGINLLRSFADRGVIYGRNPQGMRKSLHETYGWLPPVTDVKPHLDNLLGKSSSFTDIPRSLFRTGFCWRGRIYSAHVKPSRVALRHRELCTSFIYAYGGLRVRAHSSAQAEEEEVDISNEDEDEWRAEDERRAEEKRRQAEQEEEDRKHREEELADQERRVAERAEEEKRVIDKERRRVAKEREAAKQKEGEEARRERSRNQHRGKARARERAGSSSAHLEPKRSRR